MDNWIHWIQWYLYGATTTQPVPAANSWELRAPHPSILLPARDSTPENRTVGMNVAIDYRNLDYDGDTSRSVSF